MRYDATVRAYDCMDQVVVGATVTMTDPWGEPVKKQLYVFGTSVPGEGLDDPRQWLQEALLALIEVL